MKKDNLLLKEDGFVNHKPFGSDHFGEWAEKFARFFGTPKFLIGQSIFVFFWIVYNCLKTSPFDPYPFILLNLAFSTQAAYAAPLILLAQTRQAERDREWEKSDAEHREELHLAVLSQQKNSSEMTNQILDLTKKIDSLVTEMHQLTISSKKRTKKAL